MAKNKSGSGSKKTGSLQQEMDDKVYNLISSLLDSKGQELKAKFPNEQDPYKTIAFAKDLSGQEIYFYIKQTDKSFSRVKDIHLKHSIDRVWKVFKDEEYDEIQSMGLDPYTLEEQNESDIFNEEDLMDVKDTNKANKSITDLWKLTDATSNSNNNNTTNAQSESEKETKIEEVTNSNNNEEEKKSKKRTKESNKPAKRLKANKDRTPPTITLNTLGGLDDIIPQLMEVVGMPILHPEIYVSMGIQPPRGVLLHGPPGCGKTTIANALAGELQVPFISLSAPSVVSGMSGESEKKVREIFEEARQLAPCLVFFDEIDAITPKRDGGAQREMERRIVAQLLTSMDELSLEKTDGKPVIVIGATNRPDSLDSALRRAGRFDREICINVPNELSRHNILSAMTKNLKTSGTLNLMKLAKMTPGFVGADLKALVTASGITAIKRIFSTLSGEQEKVLLTETAAEVAIENGNNGDAGPVEISNIDEMDLDDDVAKVDGEVDVVVVEDSATVTPIPVLNTLASLVDSNVDFDSLPTIQKFLLRHPSPLTPQQLETLTIIEDDFLEALPTIQPTAKREGFATIPDVTWNNIGALQKVRDELNMAIVHPIKTPEIYKRVGIDSPAGVLMWGPPGCGKTLLAKAVANESKANFISVKGPELLNKYVGESEKAVRQVFARARASVPCIIFFDELDALVPRRDTALSESSSRVVNTLLTELDGLNDRKGIFVVGATNRPEMIDPAMLRPGRLDKSLYIELPTADERYDIIKTVIKINKTPVDSSVDLYSIAHDERCRNFSGADLSSLVREAGVSTLRRVFGDNKNTGNGMVTDENTSSGDIYVTIDDFEVALDKVRPSVSDEDRKDYDLRNKTLGSETK